MNNSKSDNAVLYMKEELLHKANAHRDVIVSQIDYLIRHLEIAKDIAMDTNADLANIPTMIGGSAIGNITASVAKASAIEDALNELKIVTL